MARSAPPAAAAAPAPRTVTRPLSDASSSMMPAEPAATPPDGSCRPAMHTTLPTYAGSIDALMRLRARGSRARRKAGGRRAEEL